MKNSKNKGFQMSAQDKYQKLLGFVRKVHDICGCYMPLKCHYCEARVLLSDIGEKINEESM